MADMKVPGGAQPPMARPAAPARTEAVRAAQRAFFQAALAAETAPAAPKPAAAPTAQAAPSARPAEEGQRYLRPGSRLDIKV